MAISGLGEAGEEGTEAEFNAIGDQDALED